MTIDWHQPSTPKYEPPPSLPMDPWHQHVSFEVPAPESLIVTEEVLDSTKSVVKADMLKAINSSRSQHKAQSRHDVRKVSDSLHSYYNSVNVLTGAQGAGKTFAALCEILGICRESENTHLLVYVKRKAYDPTFQNIRKLIEETGCRVDEVDYEDAEEYLHRLFVFKAVYNNVRRAREGGSGEWEIPKELGALEPDQIEELGAVMFAALNVKDMATPWLNTLVLFDDASGSQLFKKVDSYLNHRLRLARDDNAIYFLTIHSITSISPLIKQNCAVVFVFAGLSTERQSIIHRQMNMPLDWAEFRGAYQIMSRMGGIGHCIVCDNLTGQILAE